jgi:hypothetical protein
MHFVVFKSCVHSLMEKGISYKFYWQKFKKKIIWLIIITLTPTINESTNKTENNICLPCFNFNLFNYLLVKMILDITRTNSFSKMFHLWFVECRLRMCLLDNCWCSDPRTLDPGCESLPRRPQWNTWENKFVLKQNWFNCIQTYKSYLLFLFLFNHWMIWGALI